MKYASVILSIFVGLLVVSLCSLSAVSAVAQSTFTSVPLVLDSATNATGTLSAVYASDAFTYNVTKNQVLSLTSFNVSGLYSALTGATLTAQYKVDTGYTGSNALKWAFNSTDSLKNTNIIPLVSENASFVTKTYDLYAQGITTLARVNALIIQFTNNDGGSPDKVQFDQLIVTLTYIPDTTAPTLSVPGAMTKEATSASGAVVSYVANATDAVDGIVAVTCSPVSGSSFALGTTTVVCSANDSSGNTASANFSVSVVDTTAPTLSVPGAMTKEATSASGAVVSYVANATDAVSSGLVPFCSVSSGSTFSLGNTTVSCTVSDVAYNNASASFIISVVDTTAPVITLLGNTTITLERNTFYSDASATAEDIVDGNLTSQIVVSNPVNTSVVGNYTITYDITDSKGNVATQVTRTVQIIDSPPVLTLLGNASITVEYNGTYSDAGASADDLVDGNLTSQIVVTGSVDTVVLGNYTLTYNVTDSNGNTVVLNRIVSVVDTTAPVITLIGNANVLVEYNTSYSDAGANAQDAYDGALSVSSNGSVDTTILGNYTITYDVTDSNGNVATQVVRTVSVVDTTAPVITLVGNATVSVAYNSTYVDDGATAQDNYDLALKVSVTNPVDTSVLGTYTLLYDVTDSNGNSAQANRTVIVNSYTSNDTQVRASFGNLPAGTFNFSMSQSNETSLATTDFISLNLFFELNSSLTNGNFNVTLTFSYNDSDDNGIVDNTSINEGDVNVYYHDGASWVLITPVVRNATANTLQVTVDHFTAFALLYAVPVVSSGSSGGGGGGGRGGGGSSTFVSSTSVNITGTNANSSLPTDTAQPTTNSESTNGQSTGTSLLTGAVIGALQGTKVYVAIGILAVIIIGGFVFFRMRARKKA